MRIVLQAFIIVLGLGMMVGCNSTNSRTSAPPTYPTPEPQVVIVNPPAETHEHRPGPPDHAPAHGWRRNHQYVYYPSSQVYYAPEERKYFWIEGGAWRVGVQLPDRIRIDAREGVSLQIDDDTPYAYHEAKHGKSKHDSGNGKGKGKGHGNGNGNGNSQGKGKNH